MNRLILIVNDVPVQTDALKRLDLAPGQAVDLLVCAPRLPRHASRWLTPRQQAQWRDDWASTLMAPWKSLCGPTQTLQYTVASGRLTEALAKLQANTSETLAAGPAAAGWPARVHDLRRQRLGGDLEPAFDSQTQPVRRWLAPLMASSGLSALLFLAD